MSVRFDAELLALLEASIIAILFAKYYDYWFPFLQVTED